MALIRADDFEAGISGYNITGTPTTSAAAAHTGAMGAVFNAVANIQFIQLLLAAGTRLLVGRVYVNVQTNPGANINIIQGNCASGDCKVVSLSTGALRAQIGAGTVQTSAVLSAGFHYVDFRFNTSAATATVDWAIDGVAQTQATFPAFTPADMTAWRLGLQSTCTGTLWADTVALTNTSTDYPLGANPISPTAGLASGVGSTHSAILRDLGAQPTSTPVGVGVALTPSHTLSPTIGFPTGTGAAGSIKAAVTPTAPVVIGSGAVNSSGAKVSVNAGNSAGTGTSFGNGTNITSITGTILTISMG